MTDPPFSILCVIRVFLYSVKHVQLHVSHGLDISFQFDARCDPSLRPTHRVVEAARGRAGGTEGINLRAVCVLQGLRYDLAAEGVTARKRWPVCTRARVNKGQGHVEVAEGDLFVCGTLCKLVRHVVLLLRDRQCHVIIPRVLERLAFQSNEFTRLN